MAEGSKVGGLQAHLSEYIGRYVVLASIVLVPLAGIVGDAAASIGPDTGIGHALLSVASAIGTAAAIAVWLRNRGLFEAAPLVGQAQGQALAAALPQPVTAELGTVELPPPPIEDPEAEGVARGDLPGDAEELAAPPAPDAGNMPVQPSQTEPPA